MPTSDEDPSRGTTTVTEPVAGRCAPFLDVQKVTSGYNRVPVIRDVSMQVGLGEIVLVMGPNGAGKSTLVKTITGQLGLLSGQIHLDGDDISGLKEERRAARGIGYVPQVGDVFPTLTVVENLEMGAYQFPKRDARERIDEAFDRFPQLRGLRHRHARTLSGGERSQLGIARALVARPKLLILDEPTANLAPVVATAVLNEVVLSLAGSGCAVLLIEQRVSLGLAVATWGYILTDGSVRLADSAPALRQRPDLSSLFLGLKDSQDGSADPGTPSGR
jgi:branched-chain amino acid transport system ATP-binding protein